MNIEELTEEEQQKIFSADITDKIAFIDIARVSGSRSAYDLLFKPEVSNKDEI